MGYSSESLETLRRQVDLIELLGSYLELKPAGGAYKGLCPFHEEKSPSFFIQRGASHYHCFGCGAHGDAIAFLMDHEGMGFVEAVEYLAERFRVSLKQVEGGRARQGPDKKKLKEATQLACDYFHFWLQHSDEGHAALRYLYRRGIDLAFIRLFRIGLAPKNDAVLAALAKKKGMSVEVLCSVGLLQRTSNQTVRPFFADRITFPILDYAGAPVGFSARKFKESTFGPKYINTPETALFKKSELLYGLSFCRQRIVQEKQAVIVEGQIDALRLIQEGLTLTVAGQGTAFTEQQADYLCKLGVERVYLALDSDQAGRQATIKIGSLFQSRAVEVKVVVLPGQTDPDSFLAEEGIQTFLALLEKGEDYMTFLAREWGKGVDLKAPAQKAQLVQKITALVRQWGQPLLEHESLRQLSRLLEVPEKLLKVGQAPARKNVVVPQRVSLQKGEAIDPHWTLDIDLLRWFFLEEKKGVHLIARFVRPEHFYSPVCRRIFTLLIDQGEGEEALDLPGLMKQLEGPEEGFVLGEIVKKRVDIRRVEKGVIETVEALLKRHWTWECEKLNARIASGDMSDVEEAQAIEEFNRLIKHPPHVEKDND